MGPVGIFEAKQKLLELVERASGERIGITRRGKLAAEIVPARSEPALSEIKDIFANIEKIRRRAKPLNGVATKDLIEEGRR